jgi:hypothetical protein
MAIIFPSHIQNFTGGELREVARKGYSESGVFTENHAKNVLRSESYIKSLTLKNEPWGIVMATLENNRVELEKSTEAIRQASFKLVDVCKETNEGLVDVGRKMRDNTEKVGTALQKFSNIADSTNLSKIADDAARLADSLERLSQLEVSGQLQKLIAAMAVKP